MSGIDFLADTNAVIYLLSGNACMRPYISSAIGVSVITELELLSFSGLEGEEEKSIRNMLNSCEIISLEQGIKERAIKIRRQYRMKLPDAIIAATAMERDIPLISADKELQKIAELKLELIVP